MPHGTNKAVANRQNKRAEAARIRCAHGCGRQVTKAGEVCGTCKSKESK